MSDLEHLTDDERAAMSAVLARVVGTRGEASARILARALSTSREECARLRGLLGECVEWLRDYEALRGWEDANDVIGRVTRAALDGDKPSPP